MKKDQTMKDPLGKFDWDHLYDDYDVKCAKTSRFNPIFLLLSNSQPEITTDRQLYYSILHLVAKERSVNNLLSLLTYEAIVYWKMYSTSPHTNNEIRKNRSLQTKLSDKLSAIRRFPLKIEPSTPKVISVVQDLLRLELYGMGLPVATTVMHFLYPEVVPIFDQMILRAVGYTREEIQKDHLNQSLKLYEQYLVHHWGLCQKYSSSTSGFCETPIRVVEMALWVNRGEETNSAKL